MRVIKLVFSIALTFFLYACSTTSPDLDKDINLVAETRLLDEKGVMLTQVSGLARVGDYIFVLAQDRNTLYFTDGKALSKSFESGEAEIRLMPLKLSASEALAKLPQASWEAITFAATQGDNASAQFDVYLSHEHDFEGDRHQLFHGILTIDNEKLSMSPLSSFGTGFAFLEHKSVPLKRTFNYGYEAISWQAAEQRLVALPELKSQPIYGVSRKGDVTILADAQHPLRASDMTPVSESCFLVTSNCFASAGFTDALCTSGEQQPKLSIASMQMQGQKIVLGDVLDVTPTLRFVEATPESIARATAESKPLPNPQFNMEGITAFKNGFLVVNDNIPRGNAKTMLRYIELPNLDKETCRIQ